MTTNTNEYTAVRVTRDSAADFEQTRTRFDALLPVFDSSIGVALVIDGASWQQVEAAVSERVGATGLVVLARLDQGALFSLSGDPVEATLYLVGNPIVARKIIGLESAAALYAPFRVAIYSDATGAHVSYDKPSSVFAPLGSQAVNEIAAELDEKISTAVEASCR